MTNSTLSRMAFGYATSQILQAAVRLGVPDALAAGPRPIGELAPALGCDSDGLARLVQALVVLGVVEPVPPAHVRLTELGAPLCADHPDSMRSSVLLFGEPAMWRAWGALPDAVRTGTAAFDHVHGRGLFDHLSVDPALSTVFNTAMREGAGAVAVAVAKVYDFSSARTVVDIGGGSGTLLAEVLSAAPLAAGVLFDTAAGLAGAGEPFRRAGLAGRWSACPGDFFAAVPPGDVLLLKGILHDWDDEHCRVLLRRCRAALAADGRLLIIEPLLPDRLDAPDAMGSVLSDIAMLVYTGGRERTRGQYRDLLADVGFALVTVTEPLAGFPIRVLVAQPVT